MAVIVYVKWLMNWKGKLMSNENKMPEPGCRELYMRYVGVLSLLCRLTPYLETCEEDYDLIEIALLDACEKHPSLSYTRSKCNHFTLDIKD